MYQRMPIDRPTFVRSSSRIVTAALLIASMLIVGAAVAPRADAVVPGGLRDFSLRYSNNVNGEIVKAGNTIVRCPNDTVDPTLNRNCDRSNAGTLAANNNSFDMQWVDVDGDPSTFDSSSADLTLSGRVLFAGLYWTGQQKKGGVITGANGYRGVPVPAPDETLIGRVSFGVPGSTSYRTVDAVQIDTGPIANGSGYTAFADVTSIVAAAGSGTYTVANLQTGTGGNGFGGWTLIVAISSPSEPLRNLSVFDGLRVVSSSGSVSIPLSGFKTPSSGTVRTTIGVVAAEGDAGATGDYLTVNDNLLTDATHPANNTENSTISDRGVLVTAKVPNVPNQLGYDSSFFEADGFLGNGDTSAIFAARTSNDVYAPQAITFSTELFSPDVDVTKTAAILSGAHSNTEVQPGGTIRYTITATNNGLQNAEAVRLVDDVPANVSLVGSPSVTAGVGSVGCSPSPCAASASAIVGSLGTGGILAPAESVTVEFDVEVDGDLGDGFVIDNIAQVDFVSPDLGLPITKYANVELSVAYPDPAVIKTFVGESGGQYSFEIEVRNAGSVDTTGSVEVTDTLGATGSLVSIGGTGWTCVGLVCDRSDVLAAGASHPVITVVATFGVGAESANAAALTGLDKGGQPDDPASPALDNDLGFASGGSTPLSYLDATKVFTESEASVGVETTFVIDVHNSGPSASTDTIITDQVPAGLRVVDAAIVPASAGSCSSTADSLTCIAGSIAVGDDVSVVVTVVPEVSGTMTNVASVESATTSSPINPSASLEVRPVADLRVVKGADVDVIDPGASVTYTIGIENAGPDAAADVSLTDHLPDAIDPATVVTSPDGAGSCALIDSTVECSWAGSMASGTSNSLTITGTIRAVVPVEDRHAVNSVEVSSVTDELDPADNIDSVLVRVLPYADVIADVRTTGAIEANSQSTITFVMTNDGPSQASDGVMTITIDPGLTIVWAPDSCTVVGQALTCPVGDLVSATEVSVEVVVAAGDDPAGTSYLIDLHVESDATAPIDPILVNNDAAGLLVVGLPPVIDSVGPDTGDTGGGTEVVIDGDNLTPESNVDIGDVPCTGITLISSTQLTCRTGPHDPGAVDVVVTNPDGLRSTLRGAFTYDDGYVPPSFTG